MKRTYLLLPLPLPAIAFAVMRVLPACSTVEVTGPVPEDAALSGPCQSQPQILCDASAPTTPSCLPDPDAGYYQGLIPQGTYPAGCVVNFPDPRPLTETGECILTAQCTCTDPTRTTGVQWTCVR